MDKITPRPLAPLPSSVATTPGGVYAPQPTQVTPMPPEQNPNLVNQAKSVVGDLVADYLRNNRDTIVNAVNAKVNIPIISEEMEARLFGLALDIIIEVVDEHV